MNLDYPIEISGVAYVSNNILSGAGWLKWCIRDNPQDESDTGWTFLSEIDDDNFCSKSENFSIVPYIKVIEIEPIVLYIYQMPVGTDMQLVIEKGKRYFADNETGKEIPI